MHAFSETLETVPLALAENSGYSPIETVSEVKSRQISTNNPRLGIDCLNKGTNGMANFLPVFSNITAFFLVNAELCGDSFGYICQLY